MCHLYHFSYILSAISFELAITWKSYSTLESFLLKFLSHKIKTWNLLLEIFEVQRWQNVTFISFFLLNFVFLNFLKHCNKPESLDLWFKANFYHQKYFFSCLKKILVLKSHMCWKYHYSCRDLFFSCRTIWL